MTDTCSICLSSLNSQKTYKLSCGHEFHLTCYQKCVYSNNCNIFIKCPLCRELNINIEKPHDNTYDNSKIWTKLERCKCKTKKGTRCKKRSVLFNNGKCAIHQKPLAKDKYDLMCDYIYYLIQSNNNTSTKIGMIDIGSKLCIKFPHLNNIQDILYYFFRFYYYNDQESIVDKLKIYDYYELNKDEEHSDKCMKNKILF
tara:strand:+ start:134 stop:730 length:597 start_codon:yes stop_codon:yes gene_type:complete